MALCKSLHFVVTGGYTPLNKGWSQQPVPPATTIHTTTTAAHADADADDIAELCTVHGYLSLDASVSLIFIIIYYTDRLDVTTTAAHADADVDDIADLCTVHGRWT